MPDNHSWQSRLHGSQLQHVRITYLRTYTPKAQIYATELISNLVKMKILTKVILIDAGPTLASQAKLDLLA